MMDPRAPVASYPTQPSQVRDATVDSTQNGKNSHAPVTGSTENPEENESNPVRRSERNWKQRVNEIFDILEVVADRLPVLNRLIVELLLVALVLLGGWALFRGHP